MFIKHINHIILLYNINDDLSNSYITEMDYTYIFNSIIDSTYIQRQNDICKIVDGITLNKKLNDDKRKSLLLYIQKNFVKKIHAGTSLISENTLYIVSTFVLSLKKLNNTVEVHSEENSMLFKICLRLTDPYNAASYAAYWSKSNPPEYISKCVEDSQILQRFDIEGLKSWEKDKAKKKIEKFAQNMQTILKLLCIKEPYSNFIIFIKKCEADLEIDLSEFKNMDATHTFVALMVKKEFNNALTYGFEKLLNSLMELLQTFPELFQKDTAFFDDLDETNLRRSCEMILKFDQEKTKKEALELLTFVCSSNILSNKNPDQAYQLLGLILESGNYFCLTQLSNKFFENKVDSKVISIRFDHLKQIASHIKNEEIKKSYWNQVLDSSLDCFHKEENREGIRFILSKSPSHFEKLIEMQPKEKVYFNNIFNYIQNIEDSETRQQLDEKVAKLFVTNATGYSGYTSAIVSLRRISDSELLISLVNSLADKILKDTNISGYDRINLANWLAGLLHSKNK